MMFPYCSSTNGQFGDDGLDLIRASVPEGPVHGRLYYHVIPRLHIGLLSGEKDFMVQLHDDLVKSIAW